MKSKITKCNKWLVGFALVASIAFSGCGGSMPKCDDKEVLDLVTQLVKRTPILCNPFSDDEPCQVEDFSYSAFVMKSVDKEAKVISCVAKIDKPKLSFAFGDAYVPYIARYTLDGQLLVSLDLQLGL